MKNVYDLLLIRVACLIKHGVEEKSLACAN